MSPCKTHEAWKEKKSGGKWEGRALKNREGYSSFFLSEKPVPSQPTTSQTDPGVSGKGTGGTVASPIPEKNHSNCHHPSSHAPCQRLA